MWCYIITCERQNHILFCNFNKNLQWVIHTAKYAEVEPNFKKCQIDMYVKTKNWGYTFSEVLTESSAAFISSIQLTFTQLY